MRLFKVLCLVAEVVGVGVVISTVLWVVLFMGVVWDVTDSKLYNWHSICMVLGMVFFYGNSILIFRVFQSAPKMKVKIAHASLHAAAIVLIAFGIAVEFITHYYNGGADMYSLHSWVGMAAIIIFFGQFVFGFLCYLSPWVKDKVKAIYLPIHVFFGLACFILVIAASLIGLNQNARFNKKYSELPPESVLINCIGLLHIIFGFLVVYLATSSSFKHQTLSIRDKSEVAN